MKKVFIVILLILGSQDVSLRSWVTLNVNELELFVSNILRIGVVLSGILIVIGLGLFLWTGDS